MGLRFIFMLTRNDKTVADAAEHLKTVLAAGIKHVGFKDTGLSFNALKDLNAAIKAGGATSYLEVVSLDLTSELTSAKAAIEIGVDVLLGGVHADDVLPIIKSSNIRYYPFAGDISGHPSVLEGSITEITESAKKLAVKDGVDGLDLLAYRSRQNTSELMQAVCASTSKPVIIAGSIDRAERINMVKQVGAAGFTIGTAALDGSYPAKSENLDEQLAAIMKDVAQVNNHISPYSKKNLGNSFHQFDETWSPRIAGQVNNMQIKLAKFEGDFTWHYHTEEDELFLVHKGRLLMKFRDREEMIEEGEFIVVPHGVEHCPIALSDICEVLLFEPETTLNTGNARDERSIRGLAHL